MTSTTIITSDGYTMEQAHDELRDAFRERWPHLRYQDWAEGTERWLGEGDWSDLPTMDELRREYLEATQEIIDLHHSEQA